MSQPDVGVNVGDFRLPTKEALRRAADLAFRSIELPTVEGDLAPSNLLNSGRRHLSRLIEGLGLRAAALAGDMPGLRLTDPRTVDERLEKTCGVLELAKDLGVPVVTASAGALTHPESGEPSLQAVDALRRIGEFADLRGVVYALRPTYGSSDLIARVLDELCCPSIGVCLDPAAMVMTGASPLSGFEHLAGRIQLVYARDASAGHAERTGSETALGEGDVDLVGILAMLDMADYSGSYILRRMDSQTPVADLARARDVFQRLLSPA